MNIEQKEKFNNDPLWEEAKKLTKQGRFEEANKIVGKIYKKYGEKYN